ncbi:MAG: hypothetical protein HYT36_02975 [Candidatus Staskawiczbacteria bacterium]|nr:hypothetical protein [Candidatus Staskawiczbacteria bacterium]
MKKIIKNNFGFTVIESIIVVFILGLVGIIVWAFQSNVFSLGNIVSGNIASQEETRNLFKTMTSEIRSAQPSDLGGYPIFQANTDSFIFYSDIDSDGLKERIRYFLADGILKRGVIKPSGNPLAYNIGDEQITEVVRNISNGATAIFDYYDTNYDGSTPPLAQPVNISEIRLVKITVMVDSNAANLPEPVTFTTQVSMRNLKDNL